MRRSIPLLVLALAMLAPLSAVRAQRGSSIGTVVLEDGTPVSGARIEAEDVETGRVMQTTKTKKKGQFALPLLDVGTYRFRVTHEGLLMGSLSATTRDSAGRIENEYQTPIGALQEVPELRVGLGKTVEVRVEMVPESAFADVLVVPGSRGASEKLNQANELATAGRNEDSLRLLEELVSDGQENAKIFYLMGTNQFALRRFDEAERWFRKTAELDPDQPGLHAYLGSLASERGDLEQALAAYDRELEISPDATVVAVNRAILLIRLDRREDAATALEALIERHPDQIDAYSELAALYLDLGREQEAAAVLERLEAKGKSDPAMWFNIGAGFSNRNLGDQARAAYERALALDPAFADAIRELGYLDLQDGDQASALARFERYLEIRPDAPDAESVRAVRKALTAGQ